MRRQKGAFFHEIVLFLKLAIDIAELHGILPIVLDVKLLPNTNDTVHLDGHLAT